MTWSRQQYEDRIRDRLGDLDILQHIAETRIPLALESALSTFTKDRPRQASQLFSGTGTDQTFDLTTSADWVDGWSRVISVEHPTGNIPRTQIDSHDYFTEAEGATADLIFHTPPAGGTDNIKVTFRAAWDYPDDTPSDDTNPIPEIYSQAVANLASAYVARGKANEFARQQSTSVAGDLFQRDATPLYEAAAGLETAYKDTVLGRPESEDTASQLAMAVSDVDVFPASVFHRREDYISDEALGG